MTDLRKLKYFKILDSISISSNLNCPSGVLVLACSAWVLKIVISIPGQVRPNQRETTKLLSVVSAKYTGLRLAWSPDNVLDSVAWLQTIVSDRTIQKYCVALVQSRHHHYQSVKNELFSPWYCERIVHLALRNNHSLTGTFIVSMRNQIKRMSYKILKLNLYI
jgi:hypothetical protein